MNIVAFSPDSSRLLVSGNDNVVRLFDVEGGGAPREFPQHKDAVSGSGGMRALTHITGGEASRVGLLLGLPGRAVLCCVVILPSWLSWEECEEGKATVALSLPGRSPPPAGSPMGSAS